MQTAPPISLGGGLSLQALAPGLSGRVDGGWVLLAAATLAALWRLLAGRVSSVVAGGVDAWWRDRHVLAAVAGGLAAAAPALIVGRPLFALGALATAGLFAAARRRLARWIDGTPRAAALMAALLAVPGLGLGIDVWADERRQADYDVALLLPPEGDRPGDEAAEVFRAFRTELTLALAGLPVDIAPPRLGPQERQQLDLTRPQTLLDYKGPRGAARVFIRIRYKLDENQQPSQVVVSPYFRQRSLADHLQVASDWAPRPLVGPAPIDLLALRAAFELIDYLSRSDRLRLDAAELAQAWRQLLQEYKQVLFFNAPAACAGLIREVDASSLPGANPQAERVRDLVFRRCDDPGPIAPDSAEETARAVYSAVVRP